VTTQVLLSTIHFPVCFKELNKVYLKSETLPLYLDWLFILAYIGHEIMDTLPVAKDLAIDEQTFLEHCESLEKF
jgi:hypothetical protein